MVRARFVLPLGLLSCAAPVFAEPALPERVLLSEGVTATTRKEYYTIRAATQREILADRRIGPNENAAAYTDWKIGVNFPHQASAEGCATGPVRVSLTVKYTLPRLEVQQPAEADLEQAWSKLLRQLYQHEAGHRDLGALAANEVLTMLESATPEPTCQALDAKVQAGVSGVIDRFKKLEHEYDALSRRYGQRGRPFDAMLGLSLPGVAASTAPP